jgi:hypothetical protein
MRIKSILSIFAACLISSSAHAEKFFNDGNYHLINYVIDDAVYVDQDLPGVGTHIEVTSGGGIAPGQAYGYIASYGNSHVTLSGGNLGWSLWCNDYSTATVNNSSYIRGEIGTGGYANVTFEGGSVRLAAVATEHSVINISGGSIGRSLELRDQATAFWSGGVISGMIMSGGSSSTSDTCLLICIGSNFAVNGTPIGYGQSVSAYASHGTFSGMPCLTGYLTGTLANGDRLNNSFYIFPNSDIVVAPEPATLLLLGLGVAILRKWK